MAGAVWRSEGVISTTSTLWALTLHENLPVPVVDLTGGSGTRDVIVADWPFVRGAMVLGARSRPAALERHDGPVIVERITGWAWSTGVAVAGDRGILFQFRFVPDLIVYP
jgi:hypothetical protein